MPCVCVCVSLQAVVNFDTDTESMSGDLHTEASSQPSNSPQDTVYNAHVYSARFATIRRTALVADGALLQAWQNSVHYLNDILVRFVHVCMTCVYCVSDTMVRYHTPQLQSCSEDAYRCMYVQEGTCKARGPHLRCCQAGLPERLQQCDVHVCVCVCVASRCLRSTSAPPPSGLPT